MFFKFADYLGTTLLDSCRRLGKIAIFFYETLHTIFNTRPKIKKIFYQMNYIGVDSLIIILLTGASIGAVLAVQSHIGLDRFGASRFIGPVVFLAIPIAVHAARGPRTRLMFVTGRRCIVISDSLNGGAITTQTGPCPQSGGQVELTGRLLQFVGVSIDQNNPIIRF